MAFLPKDITSNLISIRLTEKGREFLAKGFKDDNVFDIVKFSLGDSEVDYSQIEPGDNTSILNQVISEPVVSPVDLKTKIYASGVIPNGTAVVNLSTSSVEMTTYQSGREVSVTTQWSPVDGVYLEEYSWSNLGPLEDYDFGISKSVDSRSATIRTYDTTGTTTIKVRGMTSGKYALFTLNIS